MSNTTDPQIAETIRQQIGNGCLYMIGARHLVDHGNGLSFRIVCRGSKANYVKITLDAASDTYSVRIAKVGRAPSCKVTDKCSLDGIYCEQLHGIIEKYTGLATRL